VTHRVTQTDQNGEGWGNGAGVGIWQPGGMLEPQAAPIVTGDDVRGPRDPATATPPRRTGSIRRTSTIDMTRPDGWTGDLVMIGRARDLVTTDSGAEAIATAEVEVRADATRNLRAISTTPAASSLDTLLGAPVASGFRARVEAAVPEHRDACTPLYLLLDDLPVAALVSGYAMQRTGEIGRLPAASYHYNVDQCAGWRAGGTLMLVLSDEGAVPMTIGPEAPELRPLDDELAWHAYDPLPPNGMRRRRRLDVTAGEVLHVDAMFRDSYMGVDGVETIVHEYSFTGSVDPGTLQVLDAVARPRVLPYVECPDAAASAGLLAGTPVAELRRRVRQDLTGISTCTHLNDLLRSLADIGALAADAVRLTVRGRGV
jgi:hypothetical protein